MYYNSFIKLGVYFHVFWIFPNLEIILLYTSAAKAENNASEKLYKQQQ